ncbi:MAG: 50S ribosomal protein L6 [Alphaproteobacteria bacterium]|nr:50S ribosomal protein L6 [Alphaproteobacteria bacterium]
MSRIGKSPIKVPAGVTVTVNGNTVEAQGKVGKSSYTLPERVFIEREDNVIFVKPKSTEKDVRMIWGTAQRRVQTMISSVDQGATVTLELVGVGYRASVQGSKLVLQLGYSHDVEYPIPQGVVIKCDKPTSISITGPSKQQVGQIAAEIRSYRLPEPYKGKGVIRAGEFVIRKEGKKK